MSPADAARIESLRTHVKWFLFLRVVIITCFFGAFAAVQFAASDFDSATGLLHAVAAAYGFSLVSALVLKRTARVVEFTYVQLAFDVLLVTGSVLLTGAAASPFPFLYGLVILNGAILLSTQGAAVTAVMASVAYSGLLAFVVSFPSLEEITGSPTPAVEVNLVARLLMENASFAVIAYLAGVLTQRLHDAERLLLQERSETERLSRLQQALAQNIGSGLVTTDPEGKITTGNHIAAAYVAEEAAALVGRDIGDLFATLHLTREARTAFLQSTSATAPIEFQHKGPGDKDLLLRCTATPLKDTYEHPIGALYILQDVTQLREIELRQRGETDAVEPIDAEIAADDFDEAPAIDGFVGRSPAMQQIRTLIDRVAPSDATVLLCGESGTGKEVAARAIHAKSPRRDKPFVAINCGAIPEHLIESELFGHVKGAFTGAVANRAGFFRAADGGTVFLDEIAELPLPMQVKLLRVLQERVFKPVGSETHVAVNVRVIAATNKDLEQEVKAAHFREDLYYRLNVISIELPPLRDRPQDIPLLIRHFLKQFSELHRKHVVRLSVGAARRMLSYAYPGNVRELANVIEHAVTMADGETVHESHLSPQVLQPQRVHVPGPSVTSSHSVDQAPLAHPAVRPAVPAPAFFNGNGKPVVDLETHLEEYEKGILLRALEDSGGVKKRAAELLGINYRSFRHRLSKYGLNGESHADADA
jgi:two-component system response regulator PilR (NtrC family)